MLVDTIFILAVGLTRYLTEGQELPPPGGMQNKTGIFKESILRSAKYCSTIYETSTLSVLVLLMSEKSDDQKGKCFLNCMLQRYRLMSKQGAYNKDKFDPFLGYIPPSKFLQSIKGSLPTCLNEKNPEPCEKAYKFIKCFYMRAKNKNDLNTTREIMTAEGF